MADEWDWLNQIPTEQVDEPAGNGGKNAQKGNAVPSAVQDSQGNSQGTAQTTPPRSQAPAQGEAAGSEWDWLNQIPSEPAVSGSRKREESNAAQGDALGSMLDAFSNRPTAGAPPPEDNYDPVLREKAFQEGTQLGRDMGYGTTDIIMDQMTLGLGEKAAGYSQYLMGNAPDVEYGQRVHQAAMQEARRNALLGGTASTLIGDVMAPGGYARKIPGMMLEAGGQAALESQLRSLPSEERGIDDTAAAGAGGAIIGGMIGMGGRAIGGRPAEPTSQEFIQSQQSGKTLEQTGREFEEGLVDELTGAKLAGSEQIEAALNKGTTFQDSPGPRLRGRLRAKLKYRDDTADIDITPELTPVSYKALEIIDEVSRKGAEELSLRDIDNLRLRIDRMPAHQNRVDQRVKMALLDELEGFVDDSLDRAIIGGDAEAIAEWRAGRKEYEKYKSIKDAKKGAEVRLQKIFESGQDMTGRDVANYIWGVNKVGQNKYSLGVVRALKDRFGDDNIPLNSLKAGMLTSLYSGKPKEVLGKLDTFLNESSDLASELFDADTVKKLQKFHKDLASMDEKDALASMSVLGGNTLGNQLARIIQGSLAGAAASGTLTGAAIGAMAAKPLGSFWGTARKGIQKATPKTATIAGRELGPSAGPGIEEAAASSFGEYVPDAEMLKEEVMKYLGGSNGL